MKLRCENCHSDFYFEPSSRADGPQYAACTHCEFPNALPSQEPGESQVVYAQCFNCGRQMAHNPSQAIPICAYCLEGEERNVASVKEWMIKKVGGQIYGPFDLETVQAWIEEGKISDRDEVAKVGGQWKRFEGHPTFHRFFASFMATQGPSEAGASAGAPPPITSSPSLDNAANAANAAIAGIKKKLEIDWGFWAANAVGLIGTLAAVGGAAFLIMHKALVVPESWIDTGGRQLDAYVIEPLTGGGEAADPGAEEVRKLIERLTQQHPKVDAPSSTLFARGRTLFLKDTATTIKQGQKLLEQAVSVNPHDDLALAALAEVYSASGDTRLQQDALRLIKEADRLNRGSAEVHRARAAFLVATMQLGEARQEAEAALKLNPKDAEAEYYIGMSYLRTLEPKSAEALAHLQRAIELDPNLHKAYHQLGLTYLNLNEYRKAQQALQRKLALDPQNAPALADLGRLYEEVGDLNRATELYEQARRVAGEDDLKLSLNLAVLLYQARGQLARARTILTELTPEGQPPRLSLPDHKEALVHLATVQRLNGETGKSLETLQRVLEIDAAFAPALFQQGLAFLAQGKLDAAGQALRSAGVGDGLQDVQADVKLYLGRILATQGKMKDAVDEFEDAADLFKSNLVARMSLVQVHLELGQADEALSASVEGALVDPLYMERRAVRTLYYHRYPSIAGALPLFQKLAQERFYVADATANQGLLMLATGQRGAAIQAFQKALEVSADNVTALLQLGILAQSQGDARKAIEIFNHLIERNSQVGLSYVYQGMAYTDAGRYEEAEATFQKALRYDRKNPTLHDAMGVLHAKRGQPERAREAFLEALRLDPKFVPARLHLYQYVP